MDSDDLRFFEAVARTGAIGRAANELHTVQSNVTAHIRKLEAELEVPLFDRHPRGVSLTRAGERLLPFAAEIHRVLADARRAVADGPDTGGPLTIGSLESVAALRLTPILVAYSERHPRVDVTLSTGTTRELIFSVLDRRIDGAFVAGPVKHPGIVQLPILTEELVIVTRRDLGIDSLATSAGGLKAVVFREGCSYRKILEDVFAARGIRGMRLLQLGTLDGILGCVRAGAGLTLLPKAVVKASPHADQLALHPLPGARGRSTIFFIRRGDRASSYAMTGFIDVARKVYPRKQ